MIRILLTTTLMALLAACASQAPAPSVDRPVPPLPGRTTVAPAAAVGVAPPAAAPQYVVKRGDTLYRIALENGQDYRDLAAWNGITAPYTIREGQPLQVRPSVAQDNNGGGTVARPVAAAAAVEARSLDAAPSSPVAVDGLRREPRVGKEPYSDEAYARLNRQDSAAKPAAPAAPESKPDVPAAASPAVSGDDVAWAWPSNGKLMAPYSEAGNKGLDIAGKAGDAILAAADGKVVYAGSGLRGYGELVIVKHNATFLSAYAHNRKILVKEGQSVTRGQKIAEMGNSDADAVKLHFEIRKLGKPTDPMQYLPKK